MGIGRKKCFASGYKYKRFETSQELKDVVYESLIEFLREKGVVGDSFVWKKSP